MSDVRQVGRSLIGLFRVLVQYLGSAFRCFLAGRGGEGVEYLRFALQALHDDLVLIAAQRDHGSPLPPQDRVAKILIIKLDRIGDMVNTTPVFEALRERYPNARLDIVGHPGALSLLEDDPRLDRRFQYRSVLYHAGVLRPPGLKAWRLIHRLRSDRYSLVIYLRGSFPFLLLAGRSRFVAAKFRPSEPVIRRYLKPLGITDGSSEPLPLPSLHVSAASHDQVLAKYPTWGLGPSVVIHAVSAAAGKQWPLERFARVADEIALRGQTRVLFVATPSEADKLVKLKSMCKESHYFETGFRLPEVASAIAHADVFIGNDSGLAHIAAAVQTRQVVIWGGANLNMARPVAKPGYCTVLYREIGCRDGCPEIRCVGPQKLKCLLDIHEADVLAAALAQLRSAR